MSRWYVIGGHWINADFPQYISIDRNPENGFDIQNSDDGVSVIMMQLKLVKSSSEEDLLYPEEHYGLLHGTKVIFNLLQPFINKQRRVVSADS